MCRAEAAEAGLVAARAELQQHLEEQLHRANESASSFEVVRTELVCRAEAAEAGLVAAREELQRRSEEVAALSKNFGNEREELQADFKRTREELLTARRQRDIIRMSFNQRSTVVAELRGKVVALEAEAAEWEARDRERSTVVAELRGKVVALEAEAAEWEARYRGLRARLEAILRRFWVLRIARLVPQPIRHFVRERMLGGERPR